MITSKIAPRPVRWLACAVSALVVVTVAAKQAVPGAISARELPSDGEQRVRPRNLMPERPEFRPDGAERGKADEPKIAEMGADWSHEVEIRAVVDRHEYRQLQRIHVKCEVKNVSGQSHVFVQGVPPGDRYLFLRVRVFDTKGHLVPMTEYYKHEGREVVWSPGGGGNTMGGFLNASSFFRVELIPNLVYDMTRPGEYWILVEMPLNTGYPFESKEWFYVRANPIKVKVRPERFRAATEEEGNVVIDPDRP